MDKKDYKRLRKKIDDEYAQNLKSLDKIWELDQGSERESLTPVWGEPGVPSVVVSSDRQPRYGGFEEIKSTTQSQDVRSIISKKTTFDRITVLSLIDDLEKITNRPNVSRYSLYPILRRMEKKNQIKVVVQGGGKQLREYVKGEI